MIIQEIDKKILEILQNDFPLCVKPFEKIGSLLEISEKEVLERVQFLQNQKIIRRIGSVINSRGLGYVSALFGLQTSLEKEKETVKIINEYPGITHNYKREHELNLWFTLVCRSKMEMGEIVQEIKDQAQPIQLIELQAEKTYKIKGVFDVQTS